MLIRYGYSCLLHKNLTANRAVASLGQARILAGWGDCQISNRGMLIRYRYGRLLHKNLTANGAVASLGFSVSGAGGSYGFIDNYNVLVGFAGGVIFFCLTVITETNQNSFFLAACRLADEPSPHGMPCRGYYTGFPLTAFTYTHALAVLGAGSLYADAPLTVCVLAFWDFLLCKKNCLTDRAMLAFGKPGLGAGWRFPFIDLFGMRKESDCRGIGFIAFFALPDNLTLF